MSQRWYVEPEVSGELGPRTLMSGDTDPPVVHDLHFILRGWSGDPIMETFPCFIATGAAVDALTALGATGWGAAPLELELDEHQLSSDVREDPPSLLWMKVTGDPTRDDFGISSDLRLVVSERALGALRQLGMRHAIVSPWNG